MSKLTVAKLKIQTENLRSFIDETEDKMASRIAYAMETAITFATKDTDWGDETTYCLNQDALDIADLIRADLDK